MKTHEKYLTERRDSAYYAADEQKKWESTMKILHKFWDRKKDKLTVKQLKKLNNTLEEITSYISAI